jgi:D-alanyl-D-alanine carboxypeptidase
MKHSLSFLIISLYMLFPNVSLSQNNIQKYIENLKKDTLFVNSATAIMVMDAKGKTIASWNPDMPLLTASTMKTITTGVALKVLGHDFQFKTKIAHTGFIENGCRRCRSNPGLQRHIGNPCRHPFYGMDSSIGAKRDQKDQRQYCCR